MKLDQTVIDTLRPAIQASWNYIASDVYDLCSDEEEAIEMAIDADRLTTCAEDADAQQLVRDLCAQHGYSATLKFLATHIKLL